MNQTIASVTDASGATLHCEIKPDLTGLAAQARREVALHQRALERRRRAAEVRPAEEPRGNA